MESAVENSEFESVELAKNASPAPDSPEPYFAALKASEVPAGQDLPEAAAETQEEALGAVDPSKHFAAPANQSGSTTGGTAAAVTTVEAPIAAEPISIDVVKVSTSPAAELPMGAAPTAPSLWSLEPGPAVVSASNPIAIVPAAPAERVAPLDALPDPEPSDYEFAIAILERLRGFAPILVDALVATLGKCDKRMLLVILGMAPTETADPEPDPPPADPAPPPRPTWFLGNADQQVPDNGNWTWDSQGRRQQRLPSSFPRQAPNYAPTSWRTR